MNILQIHNRYKYKGGEDHVVDAEFRLLKEHGHEVQCYSVDNKSIDSVWAAIRAGVSVAYSESARTAISEMLKRCSPDIVHVHNFFPLLTPSVYDACLGLNRPVVQTLHNFRIVCPAGTLMRKGGVCEDCATGSPYHAVLHGCYRDSRLQSLPVAYMVARHRRLGTWTEKPRRLIALSKFASSRFVAAGIPEKNVTVKPNFCDDPTAPLETPRNGAIFVGRLSEEKGVRILLDAWQKVKYPLTIVGTGPLHKVLEASSPSHVSFLGETSRHSVLEAMRRAAFLVMPSIWYECFPMVLVESFAHGLPALVSGFGSMAEIVEDQTTGLHFQPGNSESLTECATWAAEHPAELLSMGRRAREKYQAHYTPEENYRQLMSIYDSVLEEEN